MGDPLEIAPPRWLSEARKRVQRQGGTLTWDPRSGARANIVDSFRLEELTAGGQDLTAMLANGIYSVRVPNTTITITIIKELYDRFQPLEMTVSMADYNLRGQVRPAYIVQFEAP